MEIKDEIFLNGTTWSAAEDIEHNTIDEFKTRDSNTLGYYIVLWTGNVYNLQEQYICHAFDPPIIIPEGELVCTAEFMTLLRKNSYWYHEPDGVIPIMVNLNQVVMPYIELIQDNNTTNKFPSLFKGYTDMNPHL